MLSSDLDLLSHSHVQCAQFIGLVATNRHAPHSIAESVLITGAFSFSCFFFFFFYVVPLMVTPSCRSPEWLHPFSSHLTFFLFRFLSSSLLFPFVKSIFFCFCPSFPGSPTSASSYCGSGERGSQSGESACVGVCVSWWKPPSHSPLDQGKSSAPSFEEALLHAVTPTKWAILAEELAVEASHC